MEINKIYNENCLETMAKMPDKFVDLVVTSPPYDGLRKYNGFSFPFEDIASELYRILKVGGTLVWIVGALQKSEDILRIEIKKVLMTCHFRVSRGITTNVEALPKLGILEYKCSI